MHFNVRPAAVVWAASSECNLGFLQMTLAMRIGEEGDCAEGPDWKCGRAREVVRR